MANENTHKLAEKIANLLKSDSASDEFNVLHTSIEKLNKRLDGIERQLSDQNSNSELPSPKSQHPSLRKYDVVEAIVDEAFANNQQTEKTCTFEPNGKPCDSCSMCSSHGF